MGLSVWHVGKVYRVPNPCLHVAGAFAIGFVLRKRSKREICIWVKVQTYLGLFFLLCFLDLQHYQKVSHLAFYQLVIS